MLQSVAAPLLRVMSISLRTHPARSSLTRCFQVNNFPAVNTRSFRTSSVGFARKKSEDTADDGIGESEPPQDPTIKSTKRRSAAAKVLESVKLARLKSEEISTIAASESSTRQKLRSAPPDRAESSGSASSVSAYPRRAASRTSSSSSVSSGSSKNGSYAAPPARPEDFMPSDSFIVTLQRRPLMPGTGVPMTLSDPSLISAVTKMRADGDPRHRYLTLVWLPGIAEGDLSSDPTKLPPDAIGTLCFVVKSGYMSASGSQASPSTQTFLLHGLKRVRIGKRLSASPFRAQITELTDSPYDLDNIRIKAYSNELAAIAKKAIGNGDLKDHFDMILQELEYRKPPQVSFLWAAMVQHGDPKLLQEVLECTDVEQRLQRVLALMKNDLDVQSIQEDIKKEIHRKMQTAQKQSLLQEQLKAIKKELGLDGDARESDMAEFTQRLQSRVLSKEGSKVVQTEMNKLSTIEPSSHEYNITRNYVDWLTILPWGLFQAESYDLVNAPIVLDQEHYGLTEVKSRILEFIAVGKLRSSVQGKIILLVGPPGVGKTSIGKSIAKALDRQFYRFSVGGMTDTAEIKGHRRTYVGAMPGKLLQALKRVQVQNPVIMIDEIDKLGKSYQGDPASALLEVLDPEQNNAFVDHYLDVPFDLSKVLFVCTANSTSTIPRPLLDRMEVIQVSGYVADEKLEIARRHLIPESRSSTGVPSGALQMTVSAMRHLIRWYCREAGVRNLKKYIDRIYRKVAVGVAKDPDFSVIISHANLHEYAGKPLYSTDRIYTSTPVGVVMGLAYTDMGGVALFVEAVTTPAPSDTKGTSSFRITGQLGDVMKESTSVALTVASRFLQKLQPENKFFQETGVVMHIPEGAVPKDGPSAGVTMVTSLLSLATNRPVRPNIAMTGEITLTAKVLPVGGIKEKLLAAKSASATTLLLPSGCRRDFDELPDFIKTGIDVHFVDSYEEVFRIAFAETDNCQVEEAGTTTPDSVQYGDDAQKILLEPPPLAVVSDADKKSESSISSEELMTRLK